MRHWRIWLYLVSMLGILGLCVFASMPPGGTGLRAPDQSAAVPASTATIVAEQAAQPTNTAAAAAAEETQAPEQPTEVAVAQQIDYCIECHSDKDHLIDTAAPEEVVVEESEGAG